MVLEFRVSSEKTADSSALPTSLRPIKPTSETAASRTRELTLADYQDRLGRSHAMLLNGAHWSMPVTENPLLNSVEIWSFLNLTDDSHPIHLHLVRFQGLDRQPFDLATYRLTPNDLGWKDTVRVDPMTVTRIIIKFEGYGALRLALPHAGTRRQRDDAPL